MDPHVVVVSGGGSGIGRAVALQQAAAGRRVLVVGRRPDALAGTAALAEDGRVETVAADLSTPGGAAAVATAVGGRTVGGLVAAAGAQGAFNQPGPTLAEVDSAWTEALRSNLFSALLLVEALTPRLADTIGRVVLVGSTAGLTGAGGGYAAAKAALHSYGRTLARSLGPRGITANVVAPGLVLDTGFFDTVDGPPAEPALARSAARTLVGRLGAPADVAACVGWLLSPEAGWTTGQVISPNGGVVLVR
ncbi:MAG: short-chain dehydrogenase/reductase [Friedmanniella sp.]|nr:short-chain dehydrogenase/reductase [Friedmanniella sp.]